MHDTFIHGLPSSSIFIHHVVTYTSLMVALCKEGNPKPVSCIYRQTEYPMIWDTASHCSASLYFQMHLGIIKLFHVLPIHKTDFAFSMLQGRIREALGLKILAKVKKYPLGAKCLKELQQWHYGIIPYTDSADCLHQFLACRHLGSITQAIMDSHPRHLLSMEAARLPFKLYRHLSCI